MLNYLNKGESVDLTKVLNQIIREVNDMDINHPGYTKLKKDLEQSNLSMSKNLDSFINKYGDALASLPKVLDILQGFSNIASTRIDWQEGITSEDIPTCGNNAVGE